MNKLWTPGVAARDYTHRDEIKEAGMGIMLQQVVDHLDKLL
ncbi:MAG: hypothetical protein O7F73_07805 [Gammaproteobacteria bacterium]|nr:hypothetical protein [Gammaproteobacteria bacterium]